MPIGNLTSQIFANIYLNELDRFVKHELKVKYYLRYGDDFILVSQNREKLIELRERTIIFLNDSLRLKMNPKNDKIFRVIHGLRFLGVVIWPNGRRLNKRGICRVERHLSLKNVSSYYGLALKHGYKKMNNQLIWWIYDLIHPRN